MLLLLLTVPVLAAPEGWVEHRNTEVTEAKKAGWSIETPADWMPMLDLDPPAPLGEGYRTREGDTYCIVTWLTRPADGEKEVLKDRGFTSESLRLGGQQGEVLSKSLEGGGAHQVAYIRSPQGGCRLVLFTRNQEQLPVLAQIQSSFRFVAGAEGTGWQRGQAGSFSFETPPGWKATVEGDGVELADGSGPAVSLALVDGPGQGQSFRGYARGAGMGLLDSADSLMRFEPFRTLREETGYLAVWALKNPKGASAVTALVPLRTGQGPTRAVFAHLLAPQHADVFQRLIRSLEAR